MRTYSWSCLCLNDVHVWLSLLKDPFNFLFYLFITASPLYQFFMRIQYSESSELCVNTQNSQNNRLRCPGRCWGRTRKKCYLKLRLLDLQQSYYLKLAGKPFRASVDNTLLCHHPNQALCTPPPWWRQGRKARPGWERCLSLSVFTVM